MAGLCHVGQGLFCQQLEAGQQMPQKVLVLPHHWERGWCACSVVTWPGGRVRSGNQLVADPGVGLAMLAAPVHAASGH